MMPDIVEGDAQVRSTGSTQRRLPTLNGPGRTETAAGPESPRCSGLFFGTTVTGPSKSQRFYGVEFAKRGVIVALVAHGENSTWLSSPPRLTAGS